MWGNTRNIIGAGIAAVEVFCAACGPVGAIAGSVGVVWDGMDLVWDEGENYLW